MNTRITPFWGKFFLAIEGFVFPFLFACFAFQYTWLFIKSAPGMSESLARFLRGERSVDDLISLSIGLRYNLLIVCNILIVWGLAIRKKLIQAPEYFSDIAYPLAGTFFYLSYNVLRFLPNQLDFSLIPERWTLTCALGGYALGVIGVVISTIATYNLRDSFAVFIQVRRIVTKGLYRFVRHPIYSGYIISVSGFCLANPGMYYLILTVIFVVITVMRGRLEERKISRASEEYRRYMEQTPFLFPSLARKVERSLLSEASQRDRQ